MTRDSPEVLGQAKNTTREVGSQRPEHNDLEFRCIT